MPMSNKKLYKGIIELPRVDSIIAYNLLTREQQKSIWKQHTKRFLKKEKLTKEQKPFVTTTLKIIDFVFAELGSESIGDVYGGKYMDLHTENARAILGRDLAYKLLQDINAYSARIKSGFSPLHGEDGRCDCGLDSDDGRCSVRYPCEESNCTPIKRKGCGPWWWNRCDGECGHPNK